MQFFRDGVKLHGMEALFHLIKISVSRTILWSNIRGKLAGQGSRQEFFQGRALGDSRGGLPSHFSISRGGAQPRFLVASMVKIKEFSGQGGPCPPPLPMPAHALERMMVKQERIS